MADRKKSDPQNYLRCALPFDTVAEADAAAQAFLEEVGELRNKHRLADVTVIVSTSGLDGDGEATPRMFVQHSGDQKQKVMMLAEAYGSEKARLIALLDKVSRG